MLACLRHNASNVKRVPRNDRIVHTEFRKSLLVALAGNNLLLLGLGLLSNLLDGGEPAITLSAVWCFELVLVSTSLERKLVCANLLEVFSVRLVCHVSECHVFVNNDAHATCPRTKFKTPVGALFSPVLENKSRPSPVWAAHAAVEWAASLPFAR